MAEGGTGRRWPLLLALSLTVATAGLAGCADSEQVAQAAAEMGSCGGASGAQSEPGSFQYGGAVACKDGTETYDWVNRRSQADVQFGSGLSAGTLTIEIVDAMDRTVYEASVSGGGEGRQSSTDHGVPTSPATGDWTIELTFEDVTGSLGVQIASRPG